jgi:hypothetical protein
MPIASTRCDALAVGFDAQTMNNAYPMETHFRLIRTTRKRNSYPVEINSYHTENRHSEIRTTRKEIAAFANSYLNYFNNINAFSFNRWLKPCIILIRTWWKSNSYSMETKSYLVEKKLGLIRTWRKLIRTTRKSYVDFIGKSGVLMPSINTFLYINKGNFLNGR